MFIISLPLLQAKVTLVCKGSVLFKAAFTIIAFAAVSACFLVLYKVLSLFISSELRHVSWKMFIGD